jgi:hypothetical protein
MKPEPRLNLSCGALRSVGARDLQPGPGDGAARDFDQRNLCDVRCRHWASYRGFYDEVRGP